MIYIHIPFCHRKCTYCAFYSKPLLDPSGATTYISALCRELEMRCYSMTGPVRTVYFGGGTPSLLPIDHLARVVETLRRCYDLSALEECTLEANPEDLTPEYLSALYRLHFFNRISIGVQSLNDAELRMVNRRHTAAQAIEAVQNTAAAGFGNISVDLIYGLPGHVRINWYDTLEAVLRLPVQHLSAYALTVEPNSIIEQQIEHGKVPPVDEDVTMFCYELLLSRTREHGMKQYEISNFARPGYKSVHNSRYWNRTPYLGVGAAAHSFDGERRRWNVSDVEQYCTLLKTGEVPHEEEYLTLRDACNEYVMTALRTTEGINKSLMPYPVVEMLAAKIQKYVDNGMIANTVTHYRPTPSGLLHADGIAADLFI